jgi:hypothetical protein
MSRSFTSIAGCVFAAIAPIASSCAQDAAAPLATFKARDVIGHAWPRALVTCPVSFKPGDAKRDNLKLVDAQGAEAPFQLSRVTLHPDGSLQAARISFRAELAKNGEYRFQLLPQRAASHATTLSVTSNAEELVIRNNVAGIALLGPGEKNFLTPLRFSSANEASQSRVGDGATLLKEGLIPGPVQAILLNPDRKRTGGSHFLAAEPATAPRVTSYSCELTEQGPLFVEARVRYAFDNGGFYQVTIRVFDSDPAIELDEQFDLKRIGDAYHWQVVYGLAGGGEADWKPDLVFWKTPQGRLKGRAAELERRLEGIGLKRAPLGEKSYGSAQLTYSGPENKVCQLTAWYPWSESADYFGLVDSTRFVPGAKRENLPFVAVIPMHAGNWRASHDTFAGLLFTRADGRVELRWPLIVPPHPNSLLHTGEYDSDLPFSFGRRQWALIAGGPQDHEGLFSVYAKQGYVTLDDYKDWVLDWPADPKVSYPRLVFSTKDVARIKPILTQHPAADVLGKFLYFQDQPNPTRAQQLTGRLFADPTGIPENQRPMQSPAGQFYHNLRFGGDWLEPLLIRRAIYRQTMMTQWSHDVDELFAAGSLTPDQQRTLRSQLAAFCYLLTEPDVNPRGSMVHLGNPNMPINRFFALTIAASLIPDHPMAKEWLRVSQDYVRFKLAMNTAPGGGWSELISYFVAGYSHQLQAAAVMSKNMEFDPVVARLAVMPTEFTLNLLTPPDPRAQGRRIIPGWGHEGQFLMNHWLVAAGLIRDIDPDLARAFAWAWEQQGKPVTEPSFMEHGSGFTPRVAVHADLLQNVPKNYRPKELKSRWWPGFGAVMRAHTGDPDETYLSYHQGYLVSHCDANQGDFVLHSKGAPLVVMGPVQYTLYESAPPLAALYKSFGWHSRIHFGAQTNTGGWPGGGAISQVHATAFGDSADYLRGLGDYGPQRWTRQILFLKGKAAAGPNYFMFRDSSYPLDGDTAKLEAKWWFLKTAGVKDNVTVGPHTLEYSGPYGAGMHVGFLQPAAISSESRDARSHEQDFTVTSVGPIAAGEDAFVMLYPRRGAEAAPQYERLADGVAKITTTEGTDYAFVGRVPFTFTNADISFRGIAGAVRIYPTEVHLIISEGPGKVSCRGTVLQSDGPATKVVPLTELSRPQTFDESIKWKLGESQLPEGWRIEGAARCEVKIESDRIVGRSEGFGGHLYARRPPGLKVLPTLVIDGQTCAPGTSGDTLIIPLLPGEHTFEIRALEQPPVFRNWQAW